METAYKTNVLNQYERSLLDAVEQALAQSAKAEKTTEPDTGTLPRFGDWNSDINKIPHCSVWHWDYCQYYLN